MVQVNLNMLYVPDLQEKDKADDLAITNYLDKINEYLSKAYLLSLDYNCWMDYKCMFHPTNLDKIGSMEEINKHKANFKPLLPKESLKEIKENLGIYFMHVIRFYMIINFLEGNDYSSILEKINQSNSKILDEYERVKFGIINPSGDNISLALEMVGICEMLGFPLKEKLIKTFRIGG